MYATIQDLVNTFGVKEITQLAQSISGKRDADLTDADNMTVVNTAIEDACAEIDLELSAGFDIRAIKKLYAMGGTIPALKHFTKDAARYHLYTSISLATNANGSDHESHRRYVDAMEHIKSFVKMGIITDSEGNEIQNNNGLMVSRTCSKEVDTCHCHGRGCHDCRYDYEL